MSQVEELQRRITAALDRIGQGLEGMQSGGGADAGEIEALRRDLEDEKLAGEQKQERLKRQRGKIDAMTQELEDLKAAQAEALTALDRELQSLRKANNGLRENNRALREANEAGVAEPHLINKAMLAELEGLRAARSADRGETGAIITELSAALDAVANDQSEEA